MINNNNEPRKLWGYRPSNLETPQRTKTDKLTTHDKILEGHHAMVEGGNLHSVTRDMIIEDHHSDQDIDEDEFLKHASNLKMLRIMDKMI